MFSNKTLLSNRFVCIFYIHICVDIFRQIHIATIKLSITSFIRFDHNEYTNSD